MSVNRENPQITTSAQQGALRTLRMSVFVSRPCHRDVLSQLVILHRDYLRRPHVTVCFTASHPRLLLPHHLKPDRLYRAKQNRSPPSLRLHNPGRASRSWGIISTPRVSSALQSSPARGSLCAAGPPAELLSSRGLTERETPHPHGHCKREKVETRRTYGGKTMWQPCGFSSRSASGHSRLTEHFLGQSERSPPRRGAERMPLCPLLPPASAGTSSKHTDSH
ncbi:unnamed protein product [Pleuronectes platessa]|uniref:Uncharacterized protein n=1 Tax=Pleuronectes platessa TaxID=8262 RepID=A0A9N7UIH2_PLEPL|nr:unnamed protein product [Pleuronectes platessa]